MDSIRAISHWHQLFDGFQHSPQAFFASFDVALAKRQIPDAERSRVEFAEGAMLGGKRQYVRITRKGYTFDICAAPFGSGFFVSWWFSKSSKHGLLYATLVAIAVLAILGLLIKVSDGILPGALLASIVVPLLFLGLGYVVRQGTIGIEEEVLSIPVFGVLYKWIFGPLTYYYIDTGQAFEKAVHEAVMEVVAGFTTPIGVRAFSDIERKPIHRDLARR